MHYLDYLLYIIIIVLLFILLDKVIMDRLDINEGFVSEDGKEDYDKFVEYDQKGELIVEKTVDNSTLAETVQEATTMYNLASDGAKFIITTPLDVIDKIFGPIFSWFYSIFGNTKGRIKKYYEKFNYHLNKKIRKIHMYSLRFVSIFSNIFSIFKVIPQFIDSILGHTFSFMRLF